METVNFGEYGFSLTQTATVRSRDLQREQVSHSSHAADANETVTYDSASIVRRAVIPSSNRCAVTEPVGRLSTKSYRNGSIVQVLMLQPTVDGEKIRIGKCTRRLTLGQFGSYDMQFLTPSPEDQQRGKWSKVKWSLRDKVDTVQCEQIIGNLLEKNSGQTVTQFSMSKTRYKELKTHQTLCIAAFKSGAW